MTNGAGTEIAARISSDAFDHLEKPVIRIAEKDCPIPFSPILEKEILPQEEDIIEAVQSLM